MSEIDEVAALIRATVPEARTAHFSTSDGGLSGFTLMQLCDAGGWDLEFPDVLQGDVDDLLIGLPWDGPMRENRHGNAVLDLVTGRTAPDGV